MSYSSLNRAASDVALANRVTAAAQKEAHNNPSFGGTDFGRALVENRANAASVLMWPVAIATEAEYEFALSSGNPDPGGDPAVITDAEILSAVQANWPPDPFPPA